MSRKIQGKAAVLEYLTKHPGRTVTEIREGLCSSGFPIDSVQARLFDLEKDYIMSLPYIRRVGSGISDTGTHPFDCLPYIRRVGSYWWLSCVLTQEVSPTYVGLEVIELEPWSCARILSPLHT